MLYPAGPAQFMWRGELLHHFQRGAAWAEIICPCRRDDKAHAEVEALRRDVVHVDEQGAAQRAAPLRHRHRVCKQRTADAAPASMGRHNELRDEGSMRFGIPRFRVRFERREL